MKSGRKIIALMTSVLLILLLSSCSSTVSLDIDNTVQETAISEQDTKSEQTTNLQETTILEENNTDITNIQIIVGEKSYTVKMYDNPSAHELIERLPITIDMKELNGNEKYYYFENIFPTNAEAVRNIKTGELMLYGSDCLVLFYKDFSTSYNYTRLGYIEDTSGLAENLGNENITITLKKQVD